VWEKGKEGAEKSLPPAFYGFGNLVTAVTIIVYFDAPARRPQVSPLYGAIGAGVVMCAYVCSRNITSHPDIT
jgi:hypothetical protein